MNKKELLDGVAGTTGQTKADVEKVLESVLEHISGSLEKGENVALPGFGTFEVRERSARTGRNPQTGEELQIAASKAAAFKAATALKRRVNGE